MLSSSARVSECRDQRRHRIAPERTEGSSASSDRVVRPRRFPALAPHQAIERLQVGELAPFVGIRRLTARTRHAA